MKIRNLSVASFFIFLYSHFFFLSFFPFFFFVIKSTSRSELMLEWEKDEILS